MKVSRLALALGLGLLGHVAAQAAIVSFTHSTLAGATSVLSNSTPSHAGSDLCSGPNLCASALTYATEVGQLTVTAKDGADFDQQALVSHSHLNNAGLGVVTGFKGPLSGNFHITDTNPSLSSRKETLTLSFDKQVSLSQLFFFPDDRGNLAHELDKLDGFTLSVDGGAFVEYSFGKQGGQPVTFGTALVGQTFTFGYAKHLSIEDYYLAGMNVTAINSPVPEPSAAAMLLAGLLAASGLGLRRLRGA